MSEIIFDWMDFYQAFADRLLDFKNNREELIVKFKKIYVDANIKWSCLEKDFEGNFIDPSDIDPFTVVGVFNRKMTDENRFKIIKIVKEEFSISEEIPTSFSGIPRIRSDSPRFYAYEPNGRKEDDIGNLWEVFEAAINYSSNPHNEHYRNEFIKWFDKVKNQKGVGLSYFTTGLFWIRPYTFINLDSRNLKFIADSSLFSDDLVNEVQSIKGFPSGELYLRICEESSLVIEDSDYENLVDFSCHAFLNDVKDESVYKDYGSSENKINSSTTRYWLIAAGEDSIWWDDFKENNEIGINFPGTDDVKYKTPDEIRSDLQEKNNDGGNYTNRVNACLDFAHNMQIGDVVFIKHGISNIIGRGIIESDYKYDSSKPYSKFRKIKWTHKGNWDYEGRLPQKTLTDITDKSYLEKIKKLFEKEYDSFYDYLMDNGFYFSRETIENYLLSLKVKPFVILTGNSGTGKTKLSQLFAKYLNEIDNYKIIPVGANWTENRHILGFFNILENEPQYTPAYYLIEKSQKKSYPHFLILDEMNLSHVERYFADFLSAIESNEAIPLHGKDELEIPSNLFIIGTVNVDETTYMFSPKVLDRANTIEFKTYSAKNYMTNKFDMAKPKGDIRYLEDILMDQDIWGKPIQDMSIQELEQQFDDEFWEEYSDEMFKFQGILKKAGFDFGFRVINEITRFMLVAYKYEDEPKNWTTWKRYFDAQIKQKMLPKLHGSQKVIGETLDELLEACEGYPTSKAKLEEMIDVLDKQRYVSFIN